MKSPVGSPKYRSERALKVAILRYLQAWDIEAWSTGAGLYSPAGTPDILGVIPPTGRLLALEVKQPGKKATRIQAATLLRLASAGALAAVVSSVEEVEQFLGSSGVLPQSAPE